MMRLVVFAAVMVGLLATTPRVNAGFLLAGESESRGGGWPPPGGPDPMFTFNFTDGSGDSGFGILNAVPSNLGDGSLLVQTGTLTVTSGGARGVYALIPLVPPPSISSSGFFIADDLIYPSDNAASGVFNGYGGYPSISGSSYLDLYGLLFRGAPGEVNIWGTGSNGYAFDTNFGFGGTFGFSGGFTPSVVPEPASLTLLGIGLVGLAGYAWRRRKPAPV